MQQREYDAGAIILKEGDPSDFAYRIVSGEVEVYRELEGKSVVVGTVKSGEFLGEMGIIEGQPRSASARAKNPVTATLLERWEFLRLMSEDSTAAYRLIARLSERLRIANSKLTEVTASKAAQTVSSKGSVPATAPDEVSPEGKIKAGQSDSRLTLVSTSQQLASHLPEAGLHVEMVPFAVGRKPEAHEPAATIPIDLSLPDSKPYRLSRQHFSLSKLRDEYVVLDLGSKLGTEVNGEYIGEHFGKDFAYLKVGENAITAGGVGSPFMFKVVVAER